jgi:hypothetical protein
MSSITRRILHLLEERNEVGGRLMMSEAASGRMAMALVEHLLHQEV